MLSRAAYFDEAEVGRFRVGVVEELLRDARIDGGSEFADCADLVRRLGVEADFRGRPGARPDPGLLFVASRCFVARVEHLPRLETDVGVLHSEILLRNSLAVSTLTRVAASMT